MGIEIERKFLVPDVSFLAGSPGLAIRQGYLSFDPARTVRVRTVGERGFVTIKGTSTGPTRPEFEYEIPREDALELLHLCLPSLVEKVRHRVEHARRVWDVDVFEGDDEGLVVAEVELPSADAAVTLPPWVGREVTGDARYYNASLARRPWRTWRPAERD